MYNNRKQWTLGRRDRNETKKLTSLIIIIIVISFNGENKVNYIPTKQIVDDWIERN